MTRHVLEFFGTLSAVVVVACAFAFMTCAGFGMRRYRKTTTRLKCGDAVPAIAAPTLLIAITVALVGLLVLGVVFGLVVSPEISPD